jgi:hypothetical protein
MSGEQTLFGTIYSYIFQTLKNLSERAENLPFVRDRYCSVKKHPLIICYDTAFLLRINVQVIIWLSEYRRFTATLKSLNGFGRSALAQKLLILRPHITSSQKEKTIWEKLEP